MEETRTQKQVRLVLEQQCAELAKLLKSKVPAGVGFILLLSDYGDAGNLAYVSTIERQSTFKLLHDWLDHQDANHPAEGWDAFAMFVTELAEAVGHEGEPEPAALLARCRELRERSQEKTPEEREACAKVCDDYADRQNDLIMKEVEAGREEQLFAVTCLAERDAARTLARRIRSRTT